MKKRFLSLILAVLLLLFGCAPTVSEAPESTGSAPVPDIIFQSFVLEDTPATPQPAQQPQQVEQVALASPPVQAEYRDSWTPFLRDRIISAKQYFVYDCNTQTFLATSGDLNASIFPASVTKLFSAYVALHYILPEETLTAGSELRLIPIDASVAGLKEGDSLTVGQLLEGMLLPSGNDATYVLATAVGRMLAEDPELPPQAAIDLFVEQMNLHAAIVGLTDTHFTTPDGWHDDNHYTSMEDLMKIGILAWNHPVISRYAAVASDSIVMDDGRTLEWENTNILLDPESDYYCPYTVGLKTGYTTPAGNCLLSAFQVGEREVLIGVFGSPYTYGRFADTLLLFTQAFDLEIPEDTGESE